MKAIKQSIDLLTRKIEELKSESWTTEEQKYFEVCAQYAAVMSTLVRYSDVYSLEDLKPLAEIFARYEEKYLNGMLD